MMMGSFSFPSGPPPSRMDEPNEPYELHEQFISPIVQLPQELLLAIFLFLPDHRETFLSVCKTWREVMLSTNQFRTRISICPIKSKRKSKGKAEGKGKIDRICTEEYLPRLNVLIKRSGSSALLDIVWHLHSNLDETTTEQLIGYLLEHAPFSRWRSLEIVNCGHPIPSITQTLLDQISISEPNDSNLQDLIINNNWEWERDKPYLLDILEQSSITIPHIRVRSIRKECIYQYPNLFRGVRTLSTPTVTPRIMKLCPNLSMLHVWTLPHESCDARRVRILWVDHQFHTREIDALSVLIPHTDRYPSDTLQHPMEILKSAGIGSNKSRRFNPLIRMFYVSDLIINTSLGLEAIEWLLRRSPYVKHLTVLTQFKSDTNTNTKDSTTTGITMGIFLQFLLTKLSKVERTETEAEAGYVQETYVIENWLFCHYLTIVNLVLDRVEGVEKRVEQGDMTTIDFTYWASRILRRRASGVMERVSCERSDGSSITVTMEQVIGHVY